MTLRAVDVFQAKHVEVEPVTGVPVVDVDDSVVQLTPYITKHVYGGG